MKEELLSCKVDMCPKLVHSRGICKFHYDEYESLVLNGHTNWQRLEDTGVVGSVHQPDPVEDLNKHKCMLEHCDRVAAVRGLCPNCYQTACNMVKRNDVTWEVLINAGLAKYKSPVVNSQLGKARQAFMDAAILGGCNPKIPMTYVPIEEREPDTEGEEDAKED